MSSPVDITVVRRFPVPPASAYAWLTDFRDDDVARAGAVITDRKVVERSPQRVVYRGEQVVLGRRTWGTSEVLLHPPDRWEARVLDGPREGSRTDYHVVPDGAGSQLTVRYHLRLVSPARHGLLRILAPLVKRSLERMWDGYERELIKDASATMDVPKHA